MTSCSTRRSPWRTPSASRLLRRQSILKELHVRVVGVKYLEEPKYRAFQCQQCDEDMNDAAFVFCRTEGPTKDGKKEWCRECVRSDVEIRLCHPRPPAGVG